MTTVPDPRSLIPAANLRAFFHEALHGAARSQRLDADAAIIVYLTHLLTDYARADRLFDSTQDGLVRRPLVDIYRQALEAPTKAERELSLQRLGDLALFVAGILPNSLQRSLVDLDYYMAMGAAAYGTLSDSGAAGRRVCALRSVFAQLSRRFVDFADLLAEAVEPQQTPSPPDLMRLHELWSKTGSRRLGRRLIAYGVMPARTTSIN